MYVYRFLNEGSEVIYVGRAKNLKSRMSSHDHLVKECYEEIKKIEYTLLKNNDDSAIYERYLINKLTPKYNTQYNNASEFSFELPELIWKDYRDIKNDVDILKTPLKTKEYDTMNVKAKLKYHRERGDLISEYKKNNKKCYHIIPRETLIENKNDYKRVYENIYFYENSDLRKILKIILSFDNFSTVCRNGETYRNKILKYFEYYLYQGRFKFILRDNCYFLVCFDFELNQLILFFDEYNNISFEMESNELLDLKNILNTNFKFTNPALFQEDSDEGLYFMSYSILNICEDCMIEYKQTRRENNL